MRVACVYVPTDDNVADAPSRVDPWRLETEMGKADYIDTEKLRRTCAVLRGATASIIRHAELGGQTVGVRVPRAEL